MKRSGVQWDDRIVECVWDPQGGPVVEGQDGPQDEVKRAPAWRIHRIRDDKKDANHHSIVQKILHSIEDGVEEQQVVEAASRIRAAWKSQAREAKRKAIENGQPVNGEVEQQPPSGSLNGPPRPQAIGPAGVYRL